MAQNQGTLIIAQIRTNDSLDQYPIGNSNDLQGGTHNVTSIAERDATPSSRRLPGMICTVEEAGEILTYQLQSDLLTWAELRTGGSGGPGGDSQILDGTGSSSTWNIELGANAEIVWVGAPGTRTIAMTNVIPGTYALTVKQDTVGGKTTNIICTTHTVKWSRSAVPPWTLSANGIDVITFVIPPSNTEVLAGYLESFGVAI